MLCFVFLPIIILYMFFIAFVLFIYFSLNVTSLLLNLFCMLFLAIVTLIKGLYDMMRILTSVVFLKMWIFLRNIYFSFVLIFCLLLFHFLFLMMCLVLHVLSQVLCISDVTHCLIFLLNHHLILSCIHLASLLRFSTS